jgi:hypothetical protein
VFFQNDLLEAYLEMNVAMTCMRGFYPTQRVRIYAFAERSRSKFNVFKL